MYQYLQISKLYVHHLTFQALTLNLIEIHAHEITIIVIVRCPKRAEYFSAFKSKKITIYIYIKFLIGMTWLSKERKLHIIYIDKNVKEQIESVKRNRIYKIT